MRNVWKAIGIVGLICGTANCDLTITRTELAGSATTVSGGGTLSSVFNAAADFWEPLIHDNVTIDMQFRWLQLGSDLAQAEIFMNGDVIISFDSDTSWFADSTPASHSEYGPLQTNQIGGLTSGEYFTGGTGHALNFDLFSVALHEIGHGIAGFNPFAQPITVQAPLPAAGLTISTTATSHLNSASYPEALMVEGIGPGRRRLVSDYDLLAVAQTGGFTSVSVVPEPSSLFYMSLSVAVACGISLYRKRKHLSN